MIWSFDIVRYAARQGMLVRPSLVKEALQAIDRETLEETERNHWQAVSWDGQNDPPISTRDRWIHDHDAIGRATQEAFAQGKMVYFLLHDGKLHHYQPYVAYERGHLKLETDPTHPYHWEKAANAHIAQEIEQSVDRQVLDTALERTLELHEDRNIPVGISGRGADH